MVQYLHFGILEFPLKVGVVPKPALKATWRWNMFQRFDHVLPAEIWILSCYVWSLGEYTRIPSRIIYIGIQTNFSKKTYPTSHEGNLQVLKTEPLKVVSNNLQPSQDPSYQLCLLGSLSPPQSPKSRNSCPSSQEGWNCETQLQN